LFILYRSAFFVLLLLACLLTGCSSGKRAAATHEAQSAGARPSAPRGQTELGQPPALPRPSAPGRFADVTRAAGIHFRHDSGAFGKKYLPETMGSGVCAIDYDGDGWQDLLFVNSTDWPEHKTGRTTSALYHNNQDGTFTDVTAASGIGISMYGMGCAVGDYDNDGRDDVYITGLDGNHLFRNVDGKRFVDVTAAAGVSDPGFATGSIWFDYDNDGKLDLFVAHYVTWSTATDQSCSLDGKSKSYCTPELYKGQRGTLFHNRGGGKFEDVTKKAGLSDAKSKALGVVMVDYDNDGWMDLLVTNDTEPNKLYHNNHDGTFTDTAFAAGVAFSDAGKARAGMGADAADYDSSGKPSLIIGNFTNESLALYHNDGGSLFTDEAPASGIGPVSAKSLTFSAFFFDYDLDGLLDIFALNGHVADDIQVVQPTLSYAELPLLFRNKGGGRFEDVSTKVGAPFRQPMVGRGAAYLDYDNDGDLDLVLTTSNGPARLLRNDGGNSNDVLRVKVLGTRSNRDGIGAKVTVRVAGLAPQMRMVKSGSSYLSQSELPLTFGLGKPAPDKSARVEISWPSGRRDVVEKVKANQAVTVQEGHGIVASAAIVFSKTPAASH
jgi:hypothetical protein